jgi:hypothetical protein
MNTVQPPSGMERLDTQAQLGARLLCSGQHAGRLIVTGAIKPALVRYDSTFYATADLDQLRASAVEVLAV